MTSWIEEAPPGDNSKNYLFSSTDAICNVVQRDTNSLEYALKQYLGESDDAMPPKFIRRFEQVAFKEDIGKDAICRRNLKNIAIVKFQLASPLITRIKKKQRVSFADMLSNMGKFSATFGAKIQIQ